MNKMEQIVFVRELTNSVVENIMQKIDENKIPENWDGIELQ